MLSISSAGVLEVGRYTNLSLCLPYSRGIKGGCDPSVLFSNSPLHVHVTIVRETETGSLWRYGLYLHMYSLT